MDTSPQPNRHRRLRLAQYSLIAIAALLILAALFYAEENWRGRHAWESAKRNLAVRGQPNDWSTLIPPAVPDESNVFKAPNMTEWFVGRGNPSLSKRLTRVGTLSNQPANVKLAELIVVPPGTANLDATTTLNLRDPASCARAAQLLESTVGPLVTGVHGYYLVAKPLAQNQPVRITIPAEKPPSLAELAAALTNALPPRSPTDPRQGDWLQIEATASNSFIVHLSVNQPFGCWSAADYLAAGAGTEADFALIREALKRPFARMEGNYEVPMLRPIPNFVALRQIAQDCGDRAESDLLFAHPEKALAELTLVHDLSKLIEAAPTGRPTTLVAAMINVAISGLYAGVVADGFQHHQWREAELIALQDQLARVNLFPPLAEAFREEPISVCTSFEYIFAGPNSTDEMKKQFFGGQWKRGGREYLTFTYGPTGWIYQNMATVVNLRKSPLDAFDLDRQLVSPDAARAVGEEMNTALGQNSPFILLAAIALPNTERATRTLAQNQTRINQALITCALERYRLADGAYPDSLAALQPRFIEKIPHDLIGGQPLKYHRTEDGGFLLYSVGWNGTDDGGTVAMIYGKDAGPDPDHGDWVWRQTPQQPSVAVGREIAAKIQEP